jgi:CMP-N,N'-diacetyllegionaminic acid synthase
VSSQLVAVIPVRAGSERVPSKNTRPFHDTTLLDLKLTVMKQVRDISGIIVNTDCPQCMEIARRQQVQVQTRDARFAASNVTNDQHWCHLAEVTECDYLMMAQVTSPLIRRSTLQAAVDAWRSPTRDFDSLNSVSEERKFLWRDGKPLNYDADRTPKSQDLPKIVSLNFAITIIEREVMHSRGNVVGHHPEFLDLSRIEALDIDDSLDFGIAEHLYREKGLKWLLS